MDFLTRVTLTAFTTCVVLGTSPGARPAWLRLDLNEVRALCQRICQEGERRGGLARVEKSIHSRIQRKEQIALALAEGRMSLPQAAARFGALSEATPAFRFTVSQIHPSGTRDEQLCRYLIDWMATLVRDTNPARADAAVRRLNAELDERLRRGDPLVAP